MFCCHIVLLFYLAPLFAALSSLLGLMEPVTEGLVERREMDRANAVILAVLFQFIFGVFFLFQNSEKLINKSSGFTDHFILLSVIIEIAIFVWSYKRLKALINFNNKKSFYKLGKWCYYSLWFSLLVLHTVTGCGLYGTITIEMPSKTL